MKGIYIFCLLFLSFIMKAVSPIDGLLERIDKGDLVYDVEARWEAMKEAEAILLGEDAALAPLYQQGNTYLINPKLKGVETHSVGVLFIYRNASIED